MHANCKWIFKFNVLNNHSQPRLPSRLLPSPGPSLRRRPTSQSVDFFSMQTNEEMEITANMHIHAPMASVCAVALRRTVQRQRPRRPMRSPKGRLLTLRRRPQHHLTRREGKGKSRGKECKAHNLQACTRPRQQQSSRSSSAKPTPKQTYAKPKGKTADAQAKTPASPDKKRGKREI